MSDQSTVEADAAGSSAEQVSVSKTVSHPLTSVWNVLLTDEGAAALLGPGARLGDKGHTWQAQDGTHGVVRSYHPKEQIRFSWHAAEDAPSTMVDLHVRPAGDDATELEIVQSHLDQSADVDALTRHWQASLDRIDSDAL